MNMQAIRISLLFVLASLFTMLLVRWDMKYPPQPSHPHKVTTNQESRLSEHPTDKVVVTERPGILSPQHTLKPADVLTVHTDNMTLKIDKKWGNIIGLSLKQYPLSLNDDAPFNLMYQEKDMRYVAQSGLLGAFPEAMTFSSESSEYFMGQNGELTVKLSWQNAHGLLLEKRYNFSENSYLLGVETRLINNTDKPFDTRAYYQLLRTPSTEKSSVLGAVAMYTGAAVSTEEKHFKKVTFKSMDKENFTAKSDTGWAAMIQHYFVSAWIPPKHTTADYYSRVYGDQNYTIGLMTPALSVAPGDSYEFKATLYAGPALTEDLKTAAPYLDLTIDYGMLWFLSDSIFWVMQKLNALFPNWGVSIILVTLLIKLLFYPLSAKSYRSMAKMRVLQPKIQALKERCGEDKQTFSQEVMALYRREKVNPLGGCLPILIQIPVFISLYWVLMESVQLRHAPFILWIDDLSAMDPYFVLPILMGISMFVQQRLSPAPPDPVQAKVMMFLPLLFTGLFSQFPSGLVLYWLINNCVSILQQWWITRRLVH